jgi:hypothetical protein
VNAAESVATFVGEMSRVRVLRVRVSMTSVADAFFVAVALLTAALAELLADAIDVFDAVRGVGVGGGVTEEEAVADNTDERESVTDGEGDAVVTNDAVLSVPVRVCEEEPDRLTERITERLRLSLVGDAIVQVELDVQEALRDVDAVSDGAAERLREGDRSVMLIDLRGEAETVAATDTDWVPLQRIALGEIDADGVGLPMKETVQVRSWVSVAVATVPDTATERLSLKDTVTSRV